MNILFEKRINYKDRYLLNDYGKGDIIPLVSDTMFHVMLNNESRKQYAAYLLSLILKEDYQDDLMLITDVHVLLIKKLIASKKASSYIFYIGKYMEAKL